MRLIDEILPKKLEELYWKEKLSSSEIAKLYHCSSSYIRNLLKRYKIKTRKVSEANRVRFGINIPREELKKLYIENELSSSKIAKIYRCSPQTIRTFLKKYRIRIRTKSEARRLLFKINIPKKELKSLYLEKKISSTKIAKKFHCSPSFIRKKLKEFNIPIRPLREALLLSNKPRYKRYNFNGSLEEKAYLIGLREGDLHVYSQNTLNSSIYIQTNTTQEKFIKLLTKVFKPYGRIWIGRRDKAGARCFRCYLNKTFSFLLNKISKVENWILENPKYFAAFLAGYTDAEGTFCIYNRRDGVFSIRSQDKDILHQVWNNLLRLGIFCRPPHLVRKRGTKDKEGTICNKDIWGIWIYRKDSLLKLIELINPYLKHERNAKV